MLSWECLFEEIQFQPFPETGKSWVRTDLIRQMIPNRGSIKSKAVAKVIFLFMYRLRDLRNLQETFIRMVLSCTISSTSRQKRSKVTGMIIVKKLVN